MAATPSSTVPALGFGLGTCFQALPFQCRIKGAPLPGWVEVSPTAQASRPEIAATLLRLPARLGLGTLFHAVPFQCRIMVRGPPPTAQAFLAEVAATADTQQMMADCAVLPESLARPPPP